MNAWEVECTQSWSHAVTEEPVLHTKGHGIMMGRLSLVTRNSPASHVRCQPTPALCVARGLPLIDLTVPWCRSLWIPLLLPAHRSSMLTLATYAPHSLGSTSGCSAAVARTNSAWRSRAERSWSWEGGDSREASALWRMVEVRMPSAKTRTADNQDASDCGRKGPRGGGLCGARCG